MDVVMNIVSSFWFQTIFKLALGALLAGIIGLERSSWNKPAGFRTHSLVGISAVLVMLCGEYMAEKYNADPTRISAQLLSGIGFIGAGTILREGFNVKGLTTAAGLLAVTCIGLAIGAGYYLGGIIATIIAYVVLSSPYRVSDKLDHFDILEFHIDIISDEALKQIERILTKYEVDIKKINKKENELDNRLQTVTIVGQFNKKIFNKNQLIESISLIEHVKDVVVESVKEEVVVE